MHIPENSIPLGPTPARPGTKAPARPAERFTEALDAVLGDVDEVTTAIGAAGRVATPAVESPGTASEPMGGGEEAGLPLDPADPDPETVPVDPGLWCGIGTQPAAPQTRQQPTDPANPDPETVPVDPGLWCGIGTQPAAPQTRQQPTDPANPDPRLDPGSIDPPVDPEPRQRPTEPGANTGISRGPIDPPVDPQPRQRPTDPGANTGISRGPIDPPVDPQPRQRPTDPGANTGISRGPIDPPVDPQPRQRPTDPGANTGISRGPIEPPVDPQPRQRPTDPGANTGISRGPIEPPVDPQPRQRPTDPLESEPSASTPTIGRDGPVASADGLANAPRGRAVGAGVPLPLAQVDRALVEAVRQLREGREESRHMVLHLDPPELGAVNVRLVVRGDEIQLTMHSGHGDARSALTEQRASIQEAFTAAGLELSDFDITGGEPERRERGHERRATSAAVADPALFVADGALRL